MEEDEDSRLVSFYQNSRRHILEDIYRVRIYDLYSFKSFAKLEVFDVDISVCCPTPYSVWIFEINLQILVQSRTFLPHSDNELQYWIKPARVWGGIWENCAKHTRYIGWWEPASCCMKTVFFYISNIEFRCAIKAKRKTHKVRWIHMYKNITTIINKFFCYCFNI